MSAVVVSSAMGSGGTWTGALEAIEDGWVPVLVRDGEDVPDGNRALIAKGGSSLPAEAMVADTVSVADLLGHASAAKRSVAEPMAPYQQALFDE